MVENVSLRFMNKGKCIYYKDSEAGLRIAAGCMNGRLQIMYLNAGLLYESETKSSFRTEIVVADKVSIFLNNIYLFYESRFQ
jgi:hypothetical protein